MATTVYDVEELILDDGSTVTCKPATIAVQRKGMKLLSEMGNTDEPEYDEDGTELDKEEKGLRRILDIVVLCLKRQRPDFLKEVTDEKDNKKMVPDYALLQEIFEYETMFRVVEIYLGVKLNDPNLIQAALALAEAEEQKNRESQESPGKK